LDALILRASPNSLSAARSLGRAGIRVTIAAPDTDPAVRHSRYVADFLPLADIDDEAVESLLAFSSKCTEKPFLLATGDRDALLVARHQQRLAERFCFVSPSYDALSGIVDKARLYETARRYGIPHPKFHVVRNAGDVEAAVESIDTPCYVKPALAHEWRRYRRGKLERAANVAELRRILGDFVSLGLVAIPIEIIPGGDGDVHSVTTYIDKTGRPVAWRTKRKIRQFPLDAGDGCAQEITNEPAVAKIGLQLLAACGHRGPATVEFRRDARDNHFVLMEINARTILGQEMITRSGLDAPLLAWHDATSKPLPPPVPARPVQWTFFGPDFRAFRELRRRGSITTLEWLMSIARSRSFAYFAWDDPLPFLARVGLWIGRRLQGRFRLAPEADL
jgi:predicted ATP-grasp superfamily ATP-dependent carboligase